jgi:hypothetical protein
MESIEPGLEDNPMRKIEELLEIAALRFRLNYGFFSHSRLHLDSAQTGRMRPSSVFLKARKLENGFPISGNKIKDSLAFMSAKLGSQVIVNKSTKACYRDAHFE